MKKKNECNKHLCSVLFSNVPFFLFRSHVDIEQCASFHSFLPSVGLHINLTTHFNLNEFFFFYTGILFFSIFLFQLYKLKKLNHHNPRLFFFYSFLSFIRLFENSRQPILPLWWFPAQTGFKDISALCRPKCVSLYK